MAEVATEVIPTLTKTTSRASLSIFHDTLIEPELKLKDVVYDFYHDHLAPFIVSLGIEVLNKLKSDPSAVAVVFRRDGVQIDVALEKLRSLPKYSDIPVERIQKMDITKPIMNATLKDTGQKELLEEYIDQAGLKEASRVIFVDTGFNNTIPRRLREDFLPLKTETESMFLVTMNDQATGLIYDKNNAYVYPGDQALKAEAGAIVAILESLGKGVRQKINHLVKDTNGRVRGDFSRVEDESTRQANLSALRAIVDYIDEQPKENLVERHTGTSFLQIQRQNMEKKLNAMGPMEKSALTIDVPLPIK